MNITDKYKIYSKNLERSYTCYRLVYNKKVYCGKLRIHYEGMSDNWDKIIYSIWIGGIKVGKNREYNLWGKVAGISYRTRMSHIRKCVISDFNCKYDEFVDIVRKYTILNKLVVPISL